MDKGAWWATVHGVAKNQIGLSARARAHTHTHTHTHTQNHNLLRELVLWPCDLGIHIGSVYMRVLYLLSGSAFAFSKFIIIIDHRVPHFRFAPSLAVHMANPVTIPLFPHPLALT